MMNNIRVLCKINGTFTWECVLYFNCHRSQQPARKAPAEPPPTAASQQRRTRPPVPPDAKKRSGRGGALGSHDGKKERGVTSHDGGAAAEQEPHDANIDYRTATPQEVLE